MPRILVDVPQQFADELAPLLNGSEAKSLGIDTLEGLAWMLLRRAGAGVSRSRPGSKEREWITFATGWPDWD